MIKINPEVRQALLKRHPVVAVESTIISHGIPYPKNVETALLVEKQIREQGAIPATIGIIDGDVIIGMNEEEIEQIGQKKGILKVSRRDLPLIYAKNEWGATTVAATMILAHQAGIEVFVTGGIGGVHRGAQETFDISADLEELAKTNVTVICAGCKAILDLPLTMEYLETKGVPVLGYQTDELPNFYTRHSGIKLEHTLKNVLEAALVIKKKRENKLEGGVLIVNPIPEQYAMDQKVIDQAIEHALIEMQQKGIRGKDTTPFLLQKVSELTGGDSLESNIKLVLNNALVGAQIAKELIKLEK